MDLRAASVIRLNLAKNNLPNVHGILIAKNTLGEAWSNVSRKKHVKSVLLKK